MIAVAGPKGGCGKTTTTLGLAEAFGQSGVPTLIVDADRQLPNLHLAAGVDREPTIGSLSVGSKLKDHAQRHPENPKVRILPAPKADEKVDFKSTLEKLNSDSVQILIDCPAGVGPDAVEPIVAADKVIVVTTNTEQSFNSAQKTINTAERVGSPVEAVVINKCDQFVGKIPLEGNFPTIQSVPEQPSSEPRKESEVRHAHNTLVAELLNERYSTGIPRLDNKLDGGVYTGNVIGMTASPDSRSELLLHALASTNRHTVYITTERSEEMIFNQLNNSEIASSDSTPEIKHIDSVEGADYTETLKDPKQLIGSLPRRSNLIIDSMDRLEQCEKGTYVTFMNKICEEVKKSGSFAMLHMLDRTPVSRNRSTTKQFVDIVLRLEEIEANGRKTPELSIPTSRVDGIPNTTMTLDLF